MLLKYCNKLGCNRIISQGQVYCELHVTERTRRHKIYDQTRRDTMLAGFYHSQEWLKLRPEIIARHLSLDVYDYYVSGTVTYANTVHHIIELKDDYSKRCAIDNLIPLSSENHNRIHKLYETEKVKTQQVLRSALDAFKSSFDIE